MANKKAKIEQPKEVEVEKIVDEEGVDVTEEVIEYEEVEVPEEAPVEEPKAPQFKNNSEKGIKIKLVDEKKNFKWITVKPGDIVTIPKKIAKANGLVRVK